jgi:hypothetical protein
MSQDTNPVQEALDIENIAIRELIDSLKAELTNKKLVHALNIAIHNAIQKAPPACCFHMEKAVRRLAKIETYPSLLTK